MNESHHEPDPPAAIVPDIEVVDLDYLGDPRAVATVFITGAARFAIVDPGPSTSLPTLRRRLAERGSSVADVESILLTHIHLDHAGATGTLLRENPEIRVFVHARGAPHLTDPSRLLRSATRIYGSQMERLWGDVLPVPVAQIHELGDSDTLDVVGRSVRSAYTPGHAWHHVCFLDAASGVAFVGDTAGERYPGEQYVLPVTPPPDVDVEAWRTSLGLIQDWHPEQIMITHFGAFADPARHLREYAHRLEEWAIAVRRTLSVEATDEERSKQFEAEIALDLQRQLPAHVVAYYGHSVRSSWDGLARYWRGRDG
jgi:glyoxylase-like metal-dependent hydrolase (beta-lactamase superfamily II)